MLQDLLSLTPPVPDVRVPYGPDPLQFGELRLVRGKPTAGIVMNIHGGFWRNRYNLAHAGHFCSALAARGLATWNIEYRRVGDTGGGWPGSLEDVRQAWRFIPQLADKYNLSAERVIVAGHSAGAQLALALAAYEQSVQSVLSLAGVLDLRRAWELQLSGNAEAEFMGGSPEQAPQHYRAADPLQMAIPHSVQWILHGEQDDIVPLDFSRSYYQHKRREGENVQFLAIPKADHFDLIDPRSAAWSTVEDTILRLST